MTDKIIPLTTEHLRLMREDTAAFRAEMRTEFGALTKVVEAGFGDIRKRLSRVEQTMIGLKRDEAETAAELTEHRHALDQLDGIIKDLRERIAALEARTAH